MNLPNRFHLSDMGLGPVDEVVTLLRADGFPAFPGALIDSHEDRGATIRKQRDGTMTVRIDEGEIDRDRFNWKRHARRNTRTRNMRALEMLVAASEKYLD